jgi:nucleoside-triphosphatase
MRPRILLLTGLPGVGKSTVFRKLAELLAERGYRVGGMATGEIRQGSTRLGFEVTDLATGRRGVLAHVHQAQGPRLGKYRVNLADLEAVGVEAVRRAVAEADVVFVDEVGPMELFSPSFKQAVEEAVESGKPLVVTVHHRARDSLIQRLRAHPAARLLEVTTDNRSRLARELAEEFPSGEKL